MSSYSEYLNGKKMGLPKIVDTRPHRDAGHQTEIVKRMAAAGTLENKTPATACLLPLNAPSTAKNSSWYVGSAHSVQDQSDYTAYTSGQAVAQGAKPANAKPSQITLPCYSSAVFPEINDKIAADPQLAIIMAARQSAGIVKTCCLKWGKVNFASPCPCTASQAPKHTAS
jgi:hypothetical protein